MDKQVYVWRTNVFFCCIIKEIRHTPMVRLFSDKSNKVVGVDIGTASIKVAELEHRTGHRFNLSNYAYFYSNKKDSLYYNSFNVQYTLIADTLRMMFEEAGITEKRVYMSLPISLSFSTIFSLPQMKRSELEKTVQFEAKRFIPVAIEEIHFDWSVLKHLSNNNEQKILIVAVPNDILLKYYAIVKSLGLHLEGIELESFSLARSLVGEEKNSVLVVDIGARVTNITITEQQATSVHYHSSVSLMRIAQRLAEVMSVSYTRALDVARAQGLESTQEIKKSMQPLIDELVSEIKKANEGYVRQGGSSVHRIILSGALTTMPGLKDYLQQSCGVEVFTATPLENDIIKVPESLSKNPMVDMSVALGLAMR